MEHGTGNRQTRVQICPLAAVLVAGPGKFLDVDVSRHRNIEKNTSCRSKETMHTTEPSTEARGIPSVLLSFFPLFAKEIQLN